MITAFIKGQAIEITETVIVAESLNYLKAQFVFTTSDWNGLEKTAYFTQGEKTHSIKLDENNIAFPLHLSAGEWAVSVVGREYKNGDLVERITTDTATITVKPFKAGTETPFPEPTPTETESLKAEIGNLPDLLTRDKTSLVNAINELYRKGGTGGGENGFSPIVSVEEIEGGHRVTITDAEGEKSFDVLNGTDGYTPIKGVDYFTEADKTEIANAVLDEIPDIPTKTSQLVNDSNFVTAEYVTNAINGSLDEVEAMIDESGVLDE